MAHVLFKKSLAGLPVGHQIIPYDLQALSQVNGQNVSICVRVNTQHERRTVQNILKIKGYYFFNALSVDEFDSSVCDDIYVRADLFPQKRVLDYSDGAHHEYVLLSTLYPEKKTARLQEYYRCIENNCAHPLIKKIYIFYESPGAIDPVLHDPKIIIIPIKKRPSFGDFFAFANQNLAGERVIISNTDIYFDESLTLLGPVVFDKTVVALTRHNVPEYTGSWRRNCYSQDAWIFRVPITILGAQRVFLGHWGCDHDIRDRFVRAGFNVINPSLSVYAWHVHMSDDRAYFGNPVTGVRRLPDQLFTIKIAFTAIEDFL